MEVSNIAEFSVLMSVYHKENAAFFDLSLSSILEHQTVLPTEFVLVCDGPLNDELDAVIAKYQAAYPEVLKVYRTSTNQGLGKALNYGLEKCSYDLVARADSDDICVEDRFETQLDYMKAHPEISVVGSYIDEFEVDWTKPGRKKELPLTYDELVKMAKFRNPINHVTTMFRKNDILEIGSYHHIPYVEDYELWVRAIVNGKKLANIDKVLVHVRVGNGMVARRGNKDTISSWKILNKYMLGNKMINKLQYCRNMLAIRAFVYTPKRIKNIIYKTLLRKAVS